MKIKPLHNHIVIKQQDETETMYGNIVVPDLGKEKPLMGEVVAVGPGMYSVTGTFIENKVPTVYKILRNKPTHINNLKYSILIMQFLVNRSRVKIVCFNNTFALLYDN